MTEQEQQAFEMERIDAMRTFEIDLVNLATGHTYKESHFAHYHHTDDAGNLSLVVVQTDGQQLIQHLFNARTWSRLTEISHATKHLWKLKVH